MGKAKGGKRGSTIGVPSDGKFRAKALAAGPSRLLACSLLGHGIYNHVDLATDLASARICLLGTALGSPLILFLLG